MAVGVSRTVILRSVYADNTVNEDSQVWSTVNLSDPVNATIYATVSGGTISNFSDDGQDIGIQDKHDAVSIYGTPFNDTTTIILDLNAPLNSINVGWNYPSYRKDANPGDDTFIVSGAFWELDNRHIDGDFQSGSCNFVGGSGYDIYEIDATSDNFLFK